MKILQAGYPKSGNFWLYRLLQSLMLQAGLERKSFIRQQSIYKLAKNWELSYPEQADIDMLDILYPKCFYRISSAFRWPVEDLQEYVNQSNHVWTHSNICPTSHEVFTLFDKIIYIIRDPRDVLLSKTRFAFTPYMQKHYPTYHPGKDEFRRHELEPVMDAWRWHVQEYLRHAEQLNIYLLFYERLKDEPEAELTRLLQYLGIELLETQQREVLSHISFRKMKNNNPQHVKKGSLYGWMDELSEEENLRALSYCYPLLKLLNYPLVREVRLPSKAALSS